MIKEIICDVTKRHDFILLFDVTDGNPNGDPDAGNMPRVDPETMQGIVTDVAIKRKVRNFITVAYGNQPGLGIYVQERGILANLQKQVYQELNLEPSDKPNDDARKKMCEKYYDVRMFGAVMTTGKVQEEADQKEKGNKGKKESKKAWNCGQVRGPVQLTFARSIDPILPLDLTITRVALTNADDVKGGSEEDEKARSGQIGRKQVIPYGLYRTYGFFNPHFAQETGVTAKDLEIFWQALVNMWDIDRSASRGYTACRGLYIFTHSNELGNAPAHKLFDCLVINRKTECPARHISDYEIILNKDNLVSGVTVHNLLEV
ncbi:type I-C CRISPR-associated protein Cas7/Csd2 [Sporolituus thermophilus]|uniref:CRISPR-associated protein, Csd2 family n=1 Tax=Sporolituus thermophilus DSM 23256 TaxID=1123285 RepID=A0A1G7PCR3_9FIRM|nr:type I-C CRISPR-associated protein Cas7/Csd2 [Sporolituus thermophilus]SDF84083.1 CRISPR-associated protein, Csd2 family [Sporolituus thermophilus DSM 23256]